VRGREKCWAFSGGKTIRCKRVKCGVTAVLCNLVRALLPNDEGGLRNSLLGEALMTLSE